MARWVNGSGDYVVNDDRIVVQETYAQQFLSAVLSGNSQLANIPLRDLPAGWNTVASSAKTIADLVVSFF